jgi:H+/Cl- antiporter ClcA
MIIVPPRSLRRRRRGRQQVAAILAAIAAAISVSNVVWLRSFRGLSLRTPSAAQTWFVWALLAIVVAAVGAGILIVVRRNADGDPAHADHSEAGDDDADDDGALLRRKILLAIVIVLVTFVLGITTYLTGRPPAQPTAPASIPSIRPEG